MQKSCLISWPCTFDAQEPLPGELYSCNSLQESAPHNIKKTQRRAHCLQDRLEELWIPAHAAAMSLPLTFPAKALAKIFWACPGRFVKALRVEPENNLSCAVLVC